MNLSRRFSVASGDRPNLGLEFPPKLVASGPIL